MACALATDSPNSWWGTQTLSGLEVLDLTDNDLTEWGVEVLSEHIGPLLRDFELSSNQLTDAGIALLCERADMTGVETLILHDNAIGYDGVTALINTALPSLKHLDLAANAIGLPAALVLARWDGLARLETLDVGGDLLAADVAHALEQAVARGDAEAFPVAFDE